VLSQKRSTSKIGLKKIQVALSGEIKASHKLLS
jgi:hypothetical protein